MDTYLDLDIKILVLAQMRENNYNGNFETHDLVRITGKCGSRGFDYTDHYVQYAPPRRVNIVEAELRETA